MIASKKTLEIARFLLAGTAITVFSYAIYLALLIVLPYMFAYIVSYAAGIVFSYFINTYFVFQQRFNWKSFLQFPLVYAAQLVVNLLVLWLTVDRFGVKQEFAPLIAIAISIPITYFMSRAIIKKET